MSVPCKIVLADDHTLFRNGLRTLLGGIEGFEVVARGFQRPRVAGTVGKKPARRRAPRYRDAQENGIAAAEEALRRCPGLKIITLSMYGDEDYYFRMVSLGVKGFILKNSDIKDVVAAIEAVVEGGSFFSQELLFNLVSNLKSAPSAVPDDSAEQLSQRESEILLHICRGESNNEIADALFISKRTVDKHRSNILAKTGCKNTANLVVYAIKNNLVEI